MRKLTKAMIGFGLVALAVVAVAYGARAHKTASDTLVFGSSADPVALDGALISDGESGRVVIQIFEGLVNLKPGTTTVIPALATSWKGSNGGKSWTFALRKNVKFTDGTPFNAAAACANFNRWYNFTGSFQNPSATYYWQTVFGGFKKYDPKSGAPKGSLFKSCKVEQQLEHHDQPDRPVGVVHRRDVAAVVLDGEPDRDGQVRREPGQRRRRRRVPSDGHVCDPASDRHGAVHVPVVDAR